MTKQEVTSGSRGEQAKKIYSAPALTVHGSVRVLTQSGSGPTNELIAPYCPGTFREDQKC